jgi:hypothetical protein
LIGLNLPLPRRRGLVRQRIPGNIRQWVTVDIDPYQGLRCASRILRIVLEKNRAISGPRDANGDVIVDVDRDSGGIGEGGADDANDAVHAFDMPQVHRFRSASFARGDDEDFEDVVI